MMANSCWQNGLLVVKVLVWQLQPTTSLLLGVAAVVQMVVAALREVVLVNQVKM